MNKANTPIFILSSVIHLVALLLACLTPALLVLVWKFFSDGELSFRTDINELTKLFLLVYFVSVLHSCLLGLPTYVLLNKFSRPTYPKLMLSGFLMASLPFAVFTWPLRYAEFNVTSVINGVQTFVNGEPTAAGWYAYIQEFIAFGALGIITALVFKLSLTGMLRHGELYTHTHRPLDGLQNV